MKTISYFLLLLLLSCSKNTGNDLSVAGKEVVIDNASFNNYRILKGSRNCVQDSATIFTGTHINFIVKFDSSAAYQAASARNQGMVNRLFGFKEGAADNFNSACIGWNFENGIIHLYAYQYASGAAYISEIATAAIGEQVLCSTGLYRSQYFFSVGGKSIVLPRTTINDNVNGYLLFPAFNEQEAAPQDIDIAIAALGR